MEISLSYNLSYILMYNKTLTTYFLDGTIKSYFTIYSYNILLYLNIT